ncbi:MAG: hypothetical protein GY757_16015, partial [bacterium]|nr:hypothetical protein [bacterium]
QSLGVSSSPVLVAKGLGGYVQTLHPNDDGIINVVIKENERVEVNLRGQDFAAAGTTFSTRFDAHLSQNDTKRMLPVGSTLDAKRGIFYWQPGPGYVGDYLFVFTEKTRDGAISKKVVKVTIASK